MKSILRLSPKNYMAGLLIVLATTGIFQQGYRNVVAQIFLAVSTAIALDLTLSYVREKVATFPSSAFITGMIIALVLSPQSSWYIPVVAASAAIFQKHIIRYRGRHIFNPANFGLLFVIFTFSAYPTWWGQSFWPLLVLVGSFVCYKMRRLKLPIIFVTISALLFVSDSLLTNQPLLASMAMVNIFFAFVMLIEPRTSPITRRGIILYAVSVAWFSLIFIKTLPQYDFSLLSLALGNVMVPFFNRLNST